MSLSTDDDMAELPMDGLPPAGKVMAKHGEFTGARLAEEEPLLAKKIEELFAGGRGLSFKKISEITGVSRNTITAHLDTIGVLGVEQLRSLLGKSSLQASLLIVDRIMDDPDCIPKAALGMTAKMLGDQGNSMTGNPQTIIETRHTISFTASTVNQSIEAMKLAAANEMQRLGMGSATPEMATLSAEPKVLEMVRIIPQNADVVGGNHLVSDAKSTFSQSLDNSANDSTSDHDNRPPGEGVESA